MKLRGISIEEFEELFFKVIQKWNIYDTQVIRHKVLLNKKYKNKLHSTCELISYRNGINIHDALFSYLSNGEISRVTNEYKQTGSLYN